MTSYPARIVLNWYQNLLNACFRFSVLMEGDWLFICRLFSVKFKVLTVATLIRPSMIPVVSLDSVQKSRFAQKKGRHTRTSRQDTASGSNCDFREWKRQKFSSEID